jgi:hypothetical protein
VVSGAAGVLSGAVGELSPVGVLSAAVGVGDSSAKALGAANRASGAIAAVAAAAASARRSFMKTSEVRCAALSRHTSRRGLRVWGAGGARDS